MKFQRLYKKVSLVFPVIKITIYNTALKHSGFDQTLTYYEQDEPTSHNVHAESNQTRKSKRNILWCNPPYSMNVKTNVGKIFFKLLRKHFPPTHPMYIIFNTNKVNSVIAVSQT